MTLDILPKIDDIENLRTRKNPLDEETLSIARSIVEDVKTNGEKALLKYAERFSDIQKGGKFLFRRCDLEDALRSLSSRDTELLRRSAGRIRAFAVSQLECFSELQVEIPGGFAGHRLRPIPSCGAYAPGGRFPLPSSVLMTAVPARVAGVEDLWIASPKPGKHVLAAAAIAGANGVLGIGGAQSVAALAYGIGGVPACEKVVGPGNRFVTAAKYIVSRDVSIDMIAGPSECVVVADASANPRVIAVDLLAQAEHDEDALVGLISLEENLRRRVIGCLRKESGKISTGEMALETLSRGFSATVSNIEEAAVLSDAIAPEHLQIVTDRPCETSKRFSNFGALFIGPHSGVVFGDYGAGPNHVLPTSAASRARGGLSVFDFLRVATWLRINDPRALAELGSDTESLAHLEGLEAHAHAAALRIASGKRR